MQFLENEMKHPSHGFSYKRGEAKIIRLAKQQAKLRHQSFSAFVMDCIVRNLDEAGVLDGNGKPATNGRAKAQERLAELAQRLVHSIRNNK